MGALWYDASCTEAPGHALPGLPAFFCHLAAVSIVWLLAVTVTSAPIPVVGQPPGTV
jgi:hypothetical protein